MTDSETKPQTDTQSTPPKESPFMRIIRKLSRKEQEPIKEGLTTQTATPEETVPTSEVLTEVGINWQNTMSELAEVSPPLVLEEGGVLAILSTNETYEKNRLQREIGEVDGYICGVGFGNILSFVELNPPGVLPKAVLAVDVIPSVVLAGRISIEVLRSSEDFPSFVTALQTPAELEKIKKLIIEKESSPTIRGRLEGVNLSTLIKEIDRENQNMPSKNTEGARSSILTIIRNRFSDFKNLSQNGNMGISLADATSPDLVKSFSELPGFEDSKSVIYLTNIIDHITQRGYYFGENYKYFSILQPYYKLVNGKNSFVDTMTKMDYKLRVQKEPPIYTPENFGFENMEHFLTVQKYRQR